MLTNRQKVIMAIIRTPGIVVNVRHMVKNIRKITTQTAKGKCVITFISMKLTITHIFTIYRMFLTDELQKLHAEGFGVLVEKYRMEEDKVIHARKCFTAFVKNDITHIDRNVFKTLRDVDCDAEMFESNYNKSMDLNMKKIANHYHSNPNTLQISGETNPTDSKLHY